MHPKHEEFFKDLKVLLNKYDFILQPTEDDVKVVFGSSKIPAIESYTAALSEYLFGKHRPA